VEGSYGSQFIVYSLYERQAIFARMDKKIKNNFYDRFMGLKPEGMSDRDWFAKFGWNSQNMANKKSEWTRVEVVRPETVELISNVLLLSYVDTAKLMWGERIIRAETVPQGGGGAPCEVQASARCKKRGA